MIIATLDPAVAQQAVEFAPQAATWARSATQSQLERTRARVQALFENLDDRQTLVSLTWIACAIADELLYRGIDATLFHLYAGSVYVESKYFRSYEAAAEYADEQYVDGAVASQYACDQIGSALPRVPVCSISAGRYQRGRWW